MEMPPIAVALFGFLGAAIGGFLLFAGIDDDTAGLIIAGWALSGLGGVVLFVGLLALGVQLGVNAAKRR